MLIKFMHENFGNGPTSNRYRAFRYQILHCIQQTDTAPVGSKALALAAAAAAGWSEPGMCERGNR